MTMKTTTDRQADSSQEQTSPATTGRADSISQSVFADPQSFLKVLQKDFDQIAKSYEGGITKNDLIAYSVNGQDAQGREAAKIAIAHFDEFTHLPDRPHSMQDAAFEYKVDGQHIRGIAKSDLQLDLDLYNNKTNYYIRKGRLSDLGDCAMFGTQAVMLGGLTVATMDMPPLAALTGASAAAVGGLAAVGCYNAYKAADNYRYMADRNRRMLNSWSEINHQAS